MRPFIVDVPVRINIWIRPECQKKQWEVLKKACPSILFVQSDGGRNQQEWDSIYQNRRLIDEEIDWDCKVYRFYENYNNGLYTMGRKVSEFIWSTVDRCIFLEDDDLPSVSFFQFCADLLEKYKNDERIECVCGMNHLGVNEEVKSDYFFSRQGSIWGCATWKRVYEERNKFNYSHDPYVLSLLEQRTKHNRTAWKRLNAYAKSEYYEGHVAGSEFWYEFDMYAQNRLQIVPKYNLISNIGEGEGSVHFNTMSKRRQGIFNMKTYELDFPLKYAEYVIPDVKYEMKRNKIMGYNRSRILLLLDSIKDGDFRFIIHKIGEIIHSLRGEKLEK